MSQILAEFAVLLRQAIGRIASVASRLTVNSMGLFDFAGLDNSMGWSNCQAQPIMVPSSHVAAAVFLMATISALVPASRVFAADVTLTVRGDVPAGSLPTWHEPSAFFAFATNHAKQEFATDSVRTQGMFAEITQHLLGSSTSLSDYQDRLARSGLAQEAEMIAKAGGQLLIQVQAMPIWISSSSVTAVPQGCEGEWPTFQTVAPDPAKWEAWEAAVKATVTYFNVTHKLSNVWYQFWEEPDGRCYWTDTQAKYLETWYHFVSAARSADPHARVGGPAPAGGPAGVKVGESVPLMQAFIEYSAAQRIQPDFIAYHMFGTTPEEGQLRNRAVLSMLSANGLAAVPIVVSSWNPLAVCSNNDYQTDPSWPSPPSKLGCWQSNTEMGASYSLALMSHLAVGDVPGYQVMYGLEDVNVDGPEEFTQDWGMRTSSSKNGIRKPLYHAHTIVGRMPRRLVARTMQVSNSDQSYFPHFFSMAGVEGDKLSILLWSYVTSPGRQVFEIFKDMGYRTTDFQRWGGETPVINFLTDQIPVSSLTNVPKEQTDLETMKVAYYRQQALVTEVNRVRFAIRGFDSRAGYKMTRYLIDKNNNNAYATYLESGLAAAIAGQKLKVLDTRKLPQLSKIPGVRLEPYSVMLIEIERIR